MVAEFYVQQLASWEAMVTAAHPDAEEPVLTLSEFASDVIETSIRILAAPEPARSGLFQSRFFGAPG